MSQLLYSLKQGFEALKSIRNHIVEANLPADFPRPELPPISEEAKAALLQLLEPLEAYRIEKLETKLSRKKWAKRLGWLLCLPALVVDLMSLASNSDPSILSLIVLAGILMWVQLPEIQFKRHYKNKILPVLLDKLGDYQYSPDSCVNLDAVADFELMPSFSKKEAEDHIRGKVEDVSFEFCELTLKSRGSKSDKIQFKGGVVIISMPFHFESHTIVSQDYGSLGNAISGIKQPRVKLESVTFEAMFEVYSHDQHYARYLLSPAVMERLVELEQLFRKTARGSGISIEFKNNTVLIMASYFGNLFDNVDINLPTQDMSKIPLLQQELVLITSIIKQLKLDYLAAQNVAAQKMHARMETLAS
ncbi:DUF3137 domain-containing protein [Shewanella sp. GD03713]|uniref:DUF3137 domain-containing protein n=1 Tax=Shewanella seohaensis TaxID=755175 RepID=A0ABV4VT06_9GAMM|nr:DUF3137 domain-containing protein [Shewanella sp. GD03713]MDH1471015.1 DUF3137 domain-containing protein [Shewanella sp. GD03713]QXN26339.1 DUF3137 domain-containing protein [Shewanella putrefaciens]VEE60627.1 Protein of uncharacterised function (DUF3137) [Shewanella putrefaciens]